MRCHSENPPTARPCSGRPVIVRPFLEPRADCGLHLVTRLAEGSQIVVNHRGRAALVSLTGVPSAWRSEVQLDFHAAVVTGSPLLDAVERTHSDAVCDGPRGKHMVELT
jgi:hypothetical protein